MLEQIRRFIDYNPIFCSLFFWFVCLCFIFAIVRNSDDGDSTNIDQRIRTTANDIQQAKDSIESASDELDRAKNTLADTASRIDRSAKLNTYITESIDSNEAIIAECLKLADDGERITTAIISRHRAGTERTE